MFFLDLFILIPMTFPTPETHRNHGVFRLGLALGAQGGRGLGRGVDHGGL